MDARGETGSGLVGRDRELGLLSELIRTGRTRGQAVVLAGEPGIGKSALLAAAGAVARADGYQVLAASGVESEAQLPFAGLHQLLRPVLSVARRELRPARRRALLAAFGLEDGPPPEPFLIALAAVNTLEAIGAEHPVAILADDVQWLDPQSQEVLTFIARRAASHPVVIVGVVRDGHPGPYAAAGLPGLEIGGVDDAAADEILRVGAGVLDPADRLRIRREARGNPLALLELPGAWPGPASAAGWQPPTLSARLERAFAGRLAGLPPGTRDAVLVSAVDPEPALDEILAATSVLAGAAVTADVLGPAAAELPPLARDAVLVAAVDHADDLPEILAGASRLAGQPVGVATLEQAVAAGLIRFDDLHVEFRHPLVRSGVLHRETVTRRHAANAALAEVLAGQPYRRTWHRAQSITGPDDAVANELEESYQVSLRRGSATGAIWALERSAQLTTDPARRGRRLLLAAELAFGLGRADLVDELLARASLTKLSRLDLARMEWLREIFSDGVPGDAGRVLELCDIALEAIGAGDRHLALNLLLGAALRCWWADTGPAARARVAEVAGRLGQEAHADPRYPAILGVAEPVRQGQPVIELLSRVVIESVTDADALRLLGMAAHAVGDPVRAADFLDRAEARLRAQGRLGLLPHVRGMQSPVYLELGDWARADEAAAECRLIAHETGQPIWNNSQLVNEARSVALHGDSERALRMATEGEYSPVLRNLNDLRCCLQLARGFALISSGRNAEAVDALLQIFDPADPAYHQRERFSGVMFLAEAAVHAGRRDDARSVVTELEQVAAITPAPLLHAQLSYARAVLADDADAEELYLAAAART
jgi:AAA ATPase domain